MLQLMSETGGLKKNAFRVHAFVLYFPPPHHCTCVTPLVEGVTSPTSVWLDLTRLINATGAAIYIQF